MSSLRYTNATWQLLYGYLPFSWHFTCFLRLQFRQVSTDSWFTTAWEENDGRRAHDNTSVYSRLTFLFMETLLKYYSFAVKIKTTRTKTPLIIHMIEIHSSISSSTIHMLFSRLYKSWIYSFHPSTSFCGKAIFTESVFMCSKKIFISWLFLSICMLRCIIT